MVPRLTRRYHVPSAVRASTARIGADEARELMEQGASLVDVRRHEDPAVELEGSLRIPPDEIPARLHELPPRTPVLLACG